jgi:molecular chaperone DnaJ
MKNYYEILGVNENATTDEINKAFKQLALKWHPDRWATGTDEEKKIAEEKFKEYSEAKDILTNPQKRQEYDMQRTMDDDDDGFNPWDMFRGQTRNVVLQGEDINVEVQVSFKESYIGTTKEIHYKRKEHCHHCGGTGSEDGKEDKCPYCNGTGYIVNSSRNGNTIFQMRTTCNHCHGTGKVIKNQCKYCNGTGLEEIDVTESFDVPAGVFDNAAVCLSGKGHAPKGNGPYGDLIIHFSVSYDPYFERTSFKDLVHYEEIPFCDALVGCEIECRKPDGTTVKVKIPELTKDGEEFKQRGIGFDDIVNHSGKGDYTIIIKYTYPKRLSNKQKQLLKEFKDA